MTMPFQDHYCPLTLTYGSRTLEPTHTPESVSSIDIEIAIPIASKSNFLPQETWRKGRVLYRGVSIGFPNARYGLIVLHFYHQAL